MNYGLASSKKTNNFPALFQGGVPNLFGGVVCFNYELRVGETQKPYFPLQVVE